MNSDTLFGSYRFKAIATCAALLVVLLFRWFGQSLFYAMQQPVFSFNEPELIYRLAGGTKVAQFLTSNAMVSATADFALFMLPIAFAITLNRVFIVAFSLLLLAYFFTYNMVTGHHYHGLVGALLITVPFWAKNETRFNLLWEAVRFYWLYIFASAAFWKILRGSVFYTEQLSNILKSQQLDLLLQQPESFRAEVARYLITNPEVSHWILVINVLVQLCFLVGFFTKKFDLLLFILAIVFCVANYFVMSIISAELLILNLTLLNWKVIAVWLGSFTTSKSLHEAGGQP